MDLKTGWPGIAQPAIEKRFMNLYDVVCRAFYATTDGKMCMQRGVYVRVPLNVKQTTGLCRRFKYAHLTSTDVDRLRENVYMGGYDYEVSVAGFNRVRWRSFSIPFSKIIECCAVIVVEVILPLLRIPAWNLFLTEERITNEV